jgi:hypothetical protein
MASFDYTFTSGDTVTPTKLNAARNVKDIVNADIKSDAAIALSKLATGALPAAITVSSDNLVDGTIVNADINASAAIAGTKVAPNFGSQNVTTTGSVAGGTSSALAPIHSNRQSASAGWAVLAKSEGVSNESGIYVDASNNMEVDARSSSGVLAVLLRSSGVSFINGGNLGVGTTSPASKLTVEDNSSTAAVRITQTGSGNALVVEDSANPDATPFVVTADGSVGIGTTAVGNKLTLEGLAEIRSGNDLMFRPSANDWDMRLRAVSQRLDIYSGDNLANPIASFASTGNVGINTASPTERLEVNGTVKATAFSGPLTGNVTGNVTGNLTGTASAIADGSVSTAKIVDANVTNAKLASDIDASKLTTGTLPIDRIADDAVTNDKLSLAANAGEIKKALNADNSPPIFACRAWVNFDGTRNEGDTGASTNGANVKIRASGNVSSVLKNGTGDYTITFTTALPDANYCFTFGAGADSTIGVPSLSAKQSVAPTTTALRVVTDNGANQAMTNDIANCCVAIFR